MKKRPLLISISAFLFIASLMLAYFTMYFNSNGIDTILNKKYWQQETGGVTQKTTSAAASEVTNTTAATLSSAVQATTPAISTQITATEPDLITPPINVPPEEQYTDISIAAIGDFLIHSKVLEAHYDETNKIYDFNNAFTQVKPIISKYDYTVASLEVPLGGSSGRSYTGFPQFNSPDTLIDSLKNTGVNALLTSGTHAFDAGITGLERTINTINEKSMDIAGTRLKPADKNYIVKDIKGLKTGIINYSAVKRNSSGRISLNGNQITADQEKLINIFEYGKLNDFYDNVKNILQSMKGDGAEFFIFFIRWGTDYTTVQNANQVKIAKELCKMGIDVIIGNGPHMIQPFEVLKDESTGKTTICIYSLGNFLSNQRKEEISHKSGHTEDGVIFAVNIRRYNTGDIKIMGVEHTPTWVQLKTNVNTNKLVYMILPFNEANNQIKDAADSYKRTEKIIKESIIKFNIDDRID